MTTIKEPDLLLPLAYFEVPVASSSRAAAASAP